MGQPSLVLTVTWPALRTSGIKIFPVVVASGCRGTPPPFLCSEWKSTSRSPTSHGSSCW